MFEMQGIKNEIVIDGFNSIYYFEFGKEFTHPPERHDFWEMVYVDSGEVNAITNGMGYTLSQGQVIFHEPMEPHAHISNKKVANTMLVISFTTSSDAMKYFKGKTFTLDKTGKTLLSLFLSEAKRALGTVPGEYENKKNLDFCNQDFGSSQLLGCYLTELFILLSRNGKSLEGERVEGKTSREIAQDSLCRLMCEYLKENVYKPLTLKEMCSRFLIGKTQLCKIFRENTGQSPMEYYAEQRLKEAKRLLREKKHSVSQIADMLGYSSIHIFSRAFKKTVGFSPTEYMKRIL